MNYEIQVADRFPAGSKVEIHPRITDFFTPGQTEPVATAKMARDGSVKVSGLVEHGPYFAAAEVTDEVPDSSAPNGRREVKAWKSIAFTASNPSPAQNRDDTNAQAAREAEAAAKVFQKTSVDTASAPGGGVNVNQPMPSIHEGARGTEVLPERIEGVGKGTQLASHTVTGEAVVVGQEPLKQEDVPSRVKQSSDTETGSAAIIEDVPRQEDVGKRAKQASATETGVATTTEAHVPKPDAGATTERKTAALQDSSSKAPGTQKQAPRKAAKKAVKKRNPAKKRSR